jgi:hypothetical protein
MPNENRRKRLAVLLLIAGAAVAGYTVLPSLPHEHRVDLRLDDAASVTGVELAWSPGESRAGEAVQGGSWHFAPGKAPRTLGTHVRLPDGNYVVDVVVERGTGRDAYQRAVVLGEADHITVPLSAPRAQVDDRGSP